MTHGKFATAINCMDGRVQEPVINFMKERFGADFVDMITEPGPDGILAHGFDLGKVNSIRDRVSISVSAHGSRVVAIIGHYDCAGNPVSKEEHIEHIKRSVEIIKSWGLGVDVIGLWIDENWQAEEIT